LPTINYLITNFVQTFYDLYKKLLGQATIYGLGTIVVRVFPFIASPFLTRAFGPEALAPFVDFYSVAGIIIVLLSHGMETTFFRFSEIEKDTQKLISTSTLSVVAVSVIFMIVCYVFRHFISEVFKTPDQVHYLIMMLFILGVDGLCTMPFVMLRKREKAKRFVFVKIFCAIVNFSLLVFFIVILPKYGESGILKLIYSKDFGIGYAFLANLIASLAGFALLFREFMNVRISKFCFSLWKKLMYYSLPITLAGLAGVVNETLDRQFLKFLLPEGENTRQMAIYGTVCRVVTFMTLFRQAYLLGIEPFFFSNAKKDNSKYSYSKLMTFFVIANCIILLGICANLEWISHQYIRNSEYYSGIDILPVVLVAAVFLGIYLNLSIWYKLTNKTILGAYISLIGAAVTVAVNYIFIPEFGYWASAVATLCSYFTMMIISYFWGQNHYRIPYEVKKISIYLLVSILFSCVSYYLFGDNLVLGNGLLLIFLGIVFFVEKNSLLRLIKSTK